MKYIKTYENIENEVKEGDYVVFLDDYNEDFVKKNYPYKVDDVESKYNRAYIICDDGETKTFRAKNSQVYRKITKEEAEILLQQHKYNL